MAEPSGQRNTGGALDALPGLARVAAATWWHSTEWAVRAGIRTSLKLAETATDPRVAAELVRETRSVARGLLRDLFQAAGLDQYSPVASAADTAKKVSDAMPLAPRPREASQNGAQA